MTVKDIIYITATIIGREDLISYFEGKTEKPKDCTIETIDVMVRLCNLVVNELACSFVPLKKKQKLKASNGKIYYTSLEFSPLSIIKATSSTGSNSLIRVDSEYVVVKDDFVILEYSYFPKQLSLESDVGYLESDVPARVLAYGLASEYAISQGCFKDAVMWHKRYADSISNICAPKNHVVKERVWL